MMLYLSKLLKARKPALKAVAALLEPGEAAQRLDADHRLLWSLFADDPAAKRDFLWRVEGCRYLVLSKRAPMPSPFFDSPQVRHFAPDLRAGDHLFFSLRVNATRTRKGVGRVDIVMDALHGIAPRQRAVQRMDVAQMAATDWMTRQGTRTGFACRDLLVEDYSVLTLPRTSRAGQPRFGILDLTGTLEVTEPATFLTHLGEGFGRAKAFGCGLMLIRRG
ncbi:MAG: type I-E CRISPR-associated protein Cas6/Cse3/CasE [Rhodobacteraceae bacterium]|nr:type I-E CRISPR-associated protein Cas6/Cse3/CasE [Paracoccaceae bacterium]